MSCPSNDKPNLPVLEAQDQNAGRTSDQLAAHNGTYGREFRCVVWMPLATVLIPREALMRRFAQVATIAVLLVACSGTSSGTSTTEVAAPVAGSVPSNGITYTDEASGVSLSYPNDWQIIAVDEGASADLLEALNAPEELVAAVANVAHLFRAGLPVNSGFNPSVTVAFEAIQDGMTLDEFVDSGVRAAKQGFVSYESTEHVKTVVAGRDVVLIHSSFSASELDPNVTARVWLIQLLAVDRRTGWTVTCGLGDESIFEPDLEVCDAVVRTFELSSG
jgi:hypothetical protein